MGILGDISMTEQTIDQMEKVFEECKKAQEIVNSEIRKLDRKSETSKTELSKSDKIKKMEMIQAVAKLGLLLIDIEKDIQQMKGK